MAGAASSGPPHPFRKGDQFDLPVPGVEYFPDHPFMKQLDEAIANDSLEDVQELVTKWQNMAEPSPPRGPRNYPDSTLEPALYYAIRENGPEIVDYLLSRGVKMCSLVASEAIHRKCPPAMWQVFLNHGFDINTPLDKGLALPPLGHVLADQDLVRWFLAHGADPNAESHHGLTPFLKAVQERSLETVRLLHEAGASLAIAIPFVCSARATQEGEIESDGAARRLEVLRYLLDNGADPEAPMWAHNRYGRGNDFDYGSGLNRAIVKRAENLAEELLRRGARTDSKTMNIASRGETALELAAKYTPSLVHLVAERRKEEGIISGGRVQ